MPIDAATERPAPTAGRLVIAFAVALVIAAGLAVWLWPRSADPACGAVAAWAVRTVSHPAPAEV